MKNPKIKWILIAISLISSISFLLILNREKLKWTGFATPIDSLIQTFNEMPEGKYEIEVSRQQSDAYYQGRKGDCEKITEYFVARAHKEENKEALIYLKSNKAGFLLVEGKVHEAIALAKEAETDAERMDIVGLGNIYNTIATGYYYLGRTDSAKYYMVKGYLFATAKKLDFFISTFAINLGTYYFDRQMYGAASYYFSVALDASKRLDHVPLMLINNMTTILTRQHRYAEADSLWNIYLPKMEQAKDGYERQLYFINRTSLMQQENRWDEGRKIYSTFKPEEINERLRVPYFNEMLKQMSHDNKTSKAAFFMKFRHWLGAGYVPGVSDLFEELQNLIESNPSLLPMDTVLRWEKQFASELKNNPEASSSSNKLKALIAYKNGDTKTAYDLLKKSRSDDQAFEEKRDSLSHADFDEKSQISKLREDISIANLKVEQQRNEQKYTNYLWVLALVVLVIFIVALLLALSYRKTKLDYAVEQITFMKAEEHHLMREQELNTRIVSLSQLIVLKSQNLAKKMKFISSEDKEALHEVKKEIDELSLLGIDNKPQLADKLIDDHQIIFNRFPEFASEGNLTEKRIFILSIDGYKPKEIANVVGVSIQYVHNVRTRLRKKLNLENNVDWESLKKA